MRGLVAPPLVRQGGSRLPSGPNRKDSKDHICFCAIATTAVCCPALEELVGGGLVQLLQGQSINNTCLKVANDGESRSAQAEQAGKRRWQARGVGTQSGELGIRAACMCLVVRAAACRHRPLQPWKMPDWPPVSWSGLGGLPCSLTSCHPGRPALPCQQPRCGQRRPAGRRAGAGRGQPGCEGTSRSNVVAGPLPSSSSAARQGCPPLRTCLRLVVGSAGSTAGAPSPATAAWRATCPRHPSPAASWPPTCARAANPPFFTPPSPCLASEDWMRAAASEVIGLGAMVMV